MGLSIDKLTNKELVQYERSSPDGTTDLASELAARLEWALADLELVINEFESITENKLIPSGTDYKNIEDIKAHLK